MNFTSFTFVCVFGVFYKRSPEFSHLQVMMDLATICRTCMDTDSKYFQIYDYADESHSIREMLHVIVPQIQINDDVNTNTFFPTLICETCVGKLLSSYKFMQLCIETDNEFRQMLEDNDINMMKIEANNSDDMEDEINIYDGYSSNENDIDEAMHEVKEEKIAKNKMDLKKTDNASHITLQIIKLDNQEEECLKPDETLDIPFQLTKLNNRKRFSCKHCEKLFDRMSRLEQHLNSKHNYNLEDINIFFQRFHDMGNRNELWDNDGIELETNHENADDKQEWLDSENELLDRNKNAEDLLIKSSIKSTKSKVLKKFCCTVCGRRFDRPYRLKSHLCIAPENKAFTCKVCYFSFATEELYQIHIDKHKKSGLYYKCPQYNESVLQKTDKTEENLYSDVPPLNDSKELPKTFSDSGSHKTENKHSSPRKQNKKSSKINLIKERPKYRIVGHFPCKICGKLFGSSFPLKRHSSVHSLDKPYACEIVTCKRRFYTSSALEAHHKVHIDTPSDCPTTSYPCPICKRIRKSRKTLIDHIKSLHPNAPKFCCDHCDKMFILQEQLDRHLTIHKDLECKICGKEFTIEHTLKEHMNMHSGECPYLCPTCGKAFKYASSLRKHVARHSDVKKYQCPECPKGFWAKQDFQKHVDAHRGIKPIKRHVCDICGARFEKPSKMKRHRLIHIKF